MLGVTMLMAGVSSVVFPVLDLILPGFFGIVLLADGLHLLGYPCFLAAIVLVPAENLERTHWLGVGLDLVIMMTSAIIAGWFFIFEPLTTGNSEASIGRLFAVSNLILDLLLLCVVTLSFLSNHKPAMRSMVKAMALALVLLTTADFLAPFVSLGTSYEYRGFKSPAWGVAAGVLILAALHQKHTRYEGAAIKIPHLNRDLIRLISPVISTVMIGFIVDTAESGSKALELAKFARPDMVFLDLAKRGYVESLDERAERLEQENPNTILSPGVSN
jgi:hypothetical protein